VPGDHRAAKLRSYTSLYTAQPRRSPPVGARLCRVIIAQRSCAPTNPCPPPRSRAWPAPTGKASRVRGLGIVSNTQRRFVLFVS